MTTSRTRMARVAAAAACCLLLLFLGVARCDEDGLSEHALESVSVSAETDPVASGADSADDAAIWYNAADPSQSLIIGTDKNKDTGGLYLYDLNGTMLYFEPGDAPNNVDVRGDIVAATSRAKNGILVWHIRAEDRFLHLLGSVSNLVEDDEEIYGFCLYKSPASGKLYAFVTTKSGKVVQYELSVDETGSDDSPVILEEKRRFEVGSIAEGLVADDEQAKLYVSEENVALWQYSAEPDSSDDRRAVDDVPEDDNYDSGHLSADIEGLTIYYAANGMGYLIASSQGDSTYAVYNRTGDNEYLGSFRLVKNADAGIDGTQGSDGIDVIAKSLGPAYPYGLFVSQDGHNNDDKNQNFKLVAWENIANALDLVIDATNTNVPGMPPAPAPAPPPEGSAEVPAPPAPVPSPPEPIVAPPPANTGSAAPPPDMSTPPPPSPDVVPPPPSPAPSPPPQEQVPAAPPPVTDSEGTGDKTGVPPSGAIPEPKSSSSAGRWTFVFLVVVVLAVAGYFAHKRGYLARLPFWPFNSVQQRPKESYLQLRSFDRV